CKTSGSRARSTTRRVLAGLEVELRLSRGRRSGVEARAARRSTWTPLQKPGTSTVADCELGTSSVGTGSSSFAYFERRRAPEGHHLLRVHRRLARQAG